MSANFGNDSGSQEVELNITPIIDCFTVLITFMLASASFISIGFLEAQTPGTGSDPSATEPDTEAVIKVKSNHTAELRLKGKHSLSMTFDLNNQESMKGLGTEVQKLVDQKIAIGQILVGADDDVDYKSIADVMGELNESKFPVVVGEF